MAEGKELRPRLRPEQAPRQLHLTADLSQWSRNQKSICWDWGLSGWGTEGLGRSWLAKTTGKGCGVRRNWTARPRDGKALGQARQHSVAYPGNHGALPALLLKQGKRREKTLLQGLVEKSGSRRSYQWGVTALLESQRYWVIRAIHRQRADWGGGHREGGGEEEGREAGGPGEDSVLGTVGKSLGSCGWLPGLLTWGLPLVKMSLPTKPHTPGPKRAERGPGCPRSFFLPHFPALSRT